MKSKMWKVIAALMAAAMIACVGAACTGNENGQDSSTASVASSQDESKNESTPESSEESKTGSTEESADESTEESTEESDESTDEGSSDYSGYSAFFGSWEYNVGSEYYAFELYDDGTGKYRFTNGDSYDLRWTVEDGKLCLRAAGGLETFEYVDGKLEDTENPREYIKVEKLSIDTSSETSDYSGYSAFFGSWEYNVGSEYYAFELYDDGTGKYRFTSGESVDLRWTVEDGKLCLRAAGGLETFEYVDGKLEDTENPREYLKVETLSIDS